MELPEQYTAVSVNDLTSGSVINYSIFYERNNDYILLCRDVVLTPELIEKFARATAPNYKIYIPNEHYSDFIKVAPKENGSAAFEGYAEVKASTAGLLENVSTSGRVSPEITNEIANTVRVQIETIDPSAIIQGINSLRKVDEYLHTHCVNVSLLNGLIGKWLHFDQDNLDCLVKIGLLHDVGKLLIPLEILNKPAKLTKEEFSIMQQHPVFSLRILAQSGVNDRRILDGVLQHHEKVNGLGYPGGLHHDQISEFARITSISDVYDAMVAKRVYKEAHSPFEILAWFSQGCYSDLDIHYVDIFLNCMSDDLKGKDVLLSDGRIATVLFIHPTSFEYPIVQTDSGVVNTSPDLYCVSMVN